MGLHPSSQVSLSPNMLLLLWATSERPGLSITNILELPFKPHTPGLNVSLRFQGHRSGGVLWSGPPVG